MSHAFNSKGLQAHPHILLDSRGRPTVAVTLRLGDVQVLGDVPAGASKGKDEAQTVEVPQALRHIQDIITPLWQKAAVDLRDHAHVVQLEKLLVDRAGDNFKDLGANATLPMSRALWRLAAAVKRMPLYAYIRSAEPSLASQHRVAFLMNIFNGGLHALKKAEGEHLGQDRIDIQEIMAVPIRAQTYRDAMRMGEHIDAALQNILEARFGAACIHRADEAGFSVKGLGDSTQAISCVFEAIQQAGYKPGQEVQLALDVAASSFFDSASGCYRFQGQLLSSQQMIDYLVDLTRRYEGMIFSIEDGLDENDWSSWKKLSEALRTQGVITVGDDLFVTQLPRLQKGIQQQSAHAILIKVNQNGSMHGTFQVMKEAQKHHMRCIVSHRSGETLDDSISDIAYATGALGLKAGDPQPEKDFPDPQGWVRRCKYLRMIAMEEHA